MRIVENQRQTGLILFTPRTGSSLLAQTIRLLGGGILGEPMTDCPEAANPRGYYDIPDIRNQGWTEKNIAICGEAWAGKTVKIMYPSLFECAEQWDWIRRHQPQIFVTYRHPLEQALSRREVFRAKKNTEKNIFILVTAFLRSWSYELNRCIDMLKAEYKDHLNRVLFIDYQSHLSDPRRFCLCVAKHLRLEPDEIKIQAAVNNIDPKLYRFRFDEVAPKYTEWFDALPASALYRTICQNGFADFCVQSDD